MKSLIRSLVLVVALLAAPAAHAVDVAWTALSGYQNGFGLRVTGFATNLFENVPLGLSGGVGYTWVDPGNPERTRLAFINDNDNGTPEEWGHVWDLRVDAVWAIEISKKLEDTGILIGVRHSWFTGRFNFVGGNEDFLVETDQWGVGVGVRGGLRFTPRWSLAMAAGFDWYPYASIYSHDTTYRSDGTSVSGRGYSWSFVDKAVNQPKYVPNVMVGVTYRP